ncbi:hypothetical protein V1460_12375 [Streptomyces sp. SCSIO 30461]|uniref:hypothetical protein n=1 Tax=Streptomyces sp. SCSIO 30461 TaxID=3118085 RepID=UPI0030CCB708
MNSATESTRRRKTAGLSAAAALLLGLTTAGPASADPIPPENRTYLFEIDWVKCIDQTGATDWYEDEIYAKVVDTAPGGNNVMYTDTVGDLDPGDTAMFDHYSRVIAPKRVHVNRTGDLNPRDGDAWSENRMGTPAPLNFSVALYSEDPVFDNHIQTQQFAFTAASLARDIPDPDGTAVYTRTFVGEGGEFQVRIAVHRMW